MFQVNRELLQLKGFYLLFYGGVGALLPFIPIYLKDVGLTATETGVIIGFLPFFSSVFGPIIGGLIDRFKVHKVAFIAFCIITGLAHTSLKFIPTVNRDNTMAILPRTQTVSNTTCHTSNVILNLCDVSQIVTIENSSYSSLNKTDLSQFLVCKPDNIANNTLKASVHHNEVFGPVTFSTQLTSLQHLQSCRYLVINATFSPSEETFACHPHSSYTCYDQLEKITKSHPLEFQLQFWIVFLIMTVARTIHCAVMMFTDAVAFHYLGDQRSLFGRQRMFGSIGFIIVSVPVSVALHFLAKDDSKPDFSLAFYTYLGLIGLSAFHGLFMKIEFKQKTKNLLAGFLKLLQNKHIATFLFVATFLGIMIGGLEGFLFWFLKQLGANQLLIGLYVGVAIISEIGTFFLSSKIVSRFGEIHTLQISLVAVAVRLFSYSFVTNPWYALPSQILHGPSYSLMWTAAAAYIIGKAPPGMAVTSQAVFGSLVYGIGYGSGNLITGLAFDYLGGAWTFRMQGLVTVGVLIIFIIIQYCCLKSSPDTKDDLQVEAEMKTKVSLLDVMEDTSEKKDIA